MLLESGVRLGPYEIVAPLGAGGMGQVYRARDARLGREVAVKVLPAHLAADPGALARFELEARSVAALSHPNILAIFDVGRDGVTAYIVTELLEGKTLRQLLSEGPVPRRRALEIARQVVAGLAAAHDKGIVHRDLKPENVFASRDGSAKILDFGLARVHHLAGGDEASQATALGVATGEGTILGTVGYMAPEQVRGHTADARADIFAFGALLYELLGGTRAFRAETPAEVLTAILRQDPPALTQSATGLNASLDRLVRRCLEKDPEHRFQSARDLGFALEAIGPSDDSGATAPESQAPALTTRVRPSGRRWLVGAAVLAALTAGGLVGRWSVSPGLSRALGPLTTFSFDAAFVFGPTVSVSPDGRFVAYNAALPGAARVGSGPLGVLWVRRLDATESTPLERFSDVPGDWSADSRYLLSWAPMAGGTAVARIDVASAQRTVLTQIPGLVRGAVWLTDTGVLIGTNRGIVHVHVASGEVTDIIPVDAERDLWIGWPSPLPDGRFLYLAQAKGGTDGPEARIGSIGGMPGPAPVILRNIAFARYLSPGAVAYVRDGSAFVQPFDPVQGMMSGTT